MTTASERIELKCPLCKKVHKYQLRVDKSVVFYDVISMLSSSSSTSRKFRRLFTCPEKNEPFEATLILEESFGEKINDVEVM